MADKGTTPSPRGDSARPKSIAKHLAKDWAIMIRRDGTGEPTTVIKSSVTNMETDGWRRVN